MNYATGRHMARGPFIAAPTRSRTWSAWCARVYAGRVRFHDGDAELFPGISVHLIGGHTMGLQVVRVATRRGWVVLASDASHFYANMEQTRPFPIVFVGRRHGGGLRAAARARRRRPRMSFPGTTRW